MRARLAVGWPEHDRRALVVGLIAEYTRAAEGFQLLPGFGEFLLAALRTAARQEFRFFIDACRNEVFSGLLEDRAPLARVGFEQCLAAPALDRGREFPAEIAGIFQAIVEAKAAVGRMAVRRVAGDEGAANLILLGDRDAHVPETHVVEFAGKLEAGDVLQQTM